jgi:hypothetical protein
MLGASWRRTARYARFVDYGDAEHYRAELEALRQQVRQKDGQS